MFFSEGNCAIECFGLKCPAGTTVCGFEEKTAANNSKIVRQSLCYGQQKILLSSRKEDKNPRGRTILNKYKFIGPGIYNMERIIYLYRLSEFRQRN